MASPVLVGKRALVLVFGDLPRSPRMQNHAKQLQERGYLVDFAGYLMSDTPLADNSACNVVPLPSYRMSQAPRFLAIPLRLLLQTVFLLWIFLRQEKLDLILVQNPPFLPTLLIASLLAWWHGAFYVLDWHNLGFTILAQNRRIPSFLISALRWAELRLGRLAHLNLTVSKAMREWLIEHAFDGARTVVLYDRPVTERFHPISPQERNEFRQSLRDNLKLRSAKDVPIFVSSTSWTLDEDFNILLDALKILDKRQDFQALLIVTGKGPLRSHYGRTFQRAALQRIEWIFVWLPLEDYSKLLASADFGICLHISTSGIDLPMKLVDMMACGLPTAAKRFPAITELIHQQEWLLFDDGHQLAEIIMHLRDHNDYACLPRLGSWPEHWNKVLWPWINREYECQ